MTYDLGRIKTGNRFFDVIEPIADYLRVYLKQYVTGGSLHIVVDDGNTEDGHLAWCIGEAVQAGDRFGAAIGAALLELPEDDRIEAIDYAKENRL